VPVRIEFRLEDAGSTRTYEMCDPIDAPPLGPGGSFELAGAFPRASRADLPIGRYTLVIRIDAADAVMEEREANNDWRIEDVYVLAEGPNLAVEAFDFSPQGMPAGGRNPMRFPIAVRNIGSQPTNGPFWIEFHARPVQDGSGMEKYLCDSIRVVEPIAPGGAVRWSPLERLAYGLDEGVYLVGILIDVLDEVSEQREDDNMRWLSAKRLYVRSSSTQARGWMLYR
jgi:hypothetical protein